MEDMEEDEVGFPKADGEFTVDVRFQLKRQLLVDLIIAAFEGGSNYWITRIYREDGLPTYHLRYVSGLTVYHRPCGDDEEPAPHPLSEERLAWAIGEMSHAYPRQFSSIVSDSWDADTADAVVQLAVLGGLVYG